MWARFLGVSTLKQGAKMVANMRDPVVGAKILQLQRSSLLARVDGRSPDVLLTQNGLPPRVEISHLRQVRFSDVERYQRFNEDPFAWGACSSMKDLMGFLKQNSSKTNNDWIYKFYGKATSLSVLKIETGIEPDGLDTEKEQLIVEHIPVGQFLFSTCPKYREKLLDGKLVPNAMHEFNPDLPKSMRISDILTETEVLTWLLVNNSEQTFHEICQNIYHDVPEKSLLKRFDGDSKLVDAVTSALRSSTISLKM